MVEVNLVGIMVGQILVNKVFFPNSMSLTIEMERLAKKYGGHQVKMQPIILVDDNNVYNPLAGGKHEAYSSSLARARPQYAGGA